MIKDWLRCANAGRFDAVTVEVGGRAHYAVIARSAIEPDDMARATLGGGFPAAARAQAASAATWPNAA